MHVWILTEEPYHDNSTIRGVYSTHMQGMEALKESVSDKTKYHEDHELRQWDLHSNKVVDHWLMHAEDPHLTKKSHQEFEFFIFDPHTSKWKPCREPINELR